jgi:hypothetical protein
MTYWVGGLTGVAHTVEFPSRLNNTVKIRQNWKSTPLIRPEGMMDDFLKIK